MNDEEYDDEEYDGDVLLQRIETCVLECIHDPVLKDLPAWEKFRQQVGPMGPADELIPYEVLLPVFAIAFELAETGAHLAQAIKALDIIGHAISEEAKGGAA